MDTDENVIQGGGGALSLSRDPRPLVLPDLRSSVFICGENAVVAVVSRHAQPPSPSMKGH